MIRKMALKRNIAFILSSHMIHELEQLCNHIGIIYGGELIQEGIVAELLQDNQTLEQYYIDRLKRAKEGESNRANNSVDFAE